MAMERPRLFDRLKAGLEDGIAHERGARTLRVTEVIVPRYRLALRRQEDVRRIRTLSSQHESGWVCPTVAGLK